MNFEQHWTKLRLKIYPSIRSVDYVETHDLQINKVDKTSIGGIFNHNNKLLGFQNLPIKRIPLSFLRFDVSPTKIKNKQGFVDLMNDLVKKFKGYDGKNTLDTTKSIMWFENLGYF
jgi:hypothetical protein